MYRKAFGRLRRSVGVALLVSGWFGFQHGVAADPGRVYDAADLDLMLRRVHGQELPVRLDQQTIGPAGGTLGNAETLTLTVPAGAFEEAVTLTLELVPSADGPPAGEDIYGPLYQVNGIPDNVPGVAGRRYRVYRATTLTPPADWTLVQDWEDCPENRIITYTYTHGLDAPRYYRIDVDLLP